MKKAQEQIERLRTLVRKCYGAVFSKGGVIPEKVDDRTMGKLPDAIMTIKGSTTELVATENNKEYLPSDYGVDAFGKVKTELKGIVKPFNFAKAFYPNNYYNNTVCPIKTANVSKEIGLNLFDLSLVKDYTDAFAGLLEYPANDFAILEDIEEMYFDLTGLNAKPTNITRMLQGINLPKVEASGAKKRSIYIDLSDWDTTNLTEALNAFSRINVNNTGYVYIDIKGWKAGSLTNANMFGSFANFNSLVGMTSLEDVVKDDVKIIEGLKISISIGYSSKYSNNLSTASILALVNGLADLTGQTTQTLALGSAFGERLDSEQINGISVKEYIGTIATGKNWTISY